MSSITQSGVNRVPTQSGTAIPVGGSLTLVGAGGVTTSAVGSTVTITGSGGGGGITTLDGDTGSATGTTVNIVGTGGITTSATGDTVTIDGSSITGGITTINMDVGSITGATVNIKTGFSASAGGTVYFSGSADNGFLNFTDGSANTFLGKSSGNSYGLGSNNCTGVGYNSLPIVNGADNVTALGINSGLNYVTGNFNICIGGVYGVNGENGVTRIGNADENSGTPQTACFIEGIASVTVSNTNMVTIDTTTGQLGSQAIPTGLTWSVITADQTAAVNHGYICNKASTLALALPATSSVGDTIEVTGINTALGWQITQASGQQVFFGVVSSTLGATGTLTSSAVRDSIRMVCITANTTWQVLSSIGNITYA